MLGRWKSTSEAQLTAYRDRISSLDLWENGCFHISLLWCPSTSFIWQNWFVFIPWYFKLDTYRIQAEFFGRHVFVPGTWWQKKTIEMAHAHLDSQVKDEKIREKLKSHDNFGCKRPLVLDDYYPVFNQENVELITDPVVGLSEHGIISTSAKGGRQEHEVDVLIWGTGESEWKSWLSGANWWRIQTWWVRSWSADEGEEGSIAQRQVSARELLSLRYVFSIMHFN